MKLIFSKKVTPEARAILVKNILNQGIKSPYFTFLESNWKQTEQFEYDFIAGIGAKAILEFSNQDLQVIDEFLAEQHGNWIFTHLNYDFLNSIYSINKKKNETITDFSLATFSVPETLITLKDGTLEIFATSSFELNLIEDGNHFANLLEDETQPLLLKKVALNEYKKIGRAHV